MQKGYLSQYFKAVAVKRLSSVEVNTECSNQHELNGVKDLKNMLGSERLNNLPVRFIWLGNENEGFTEDSFVTWYDARERHPTRTEFRLYFKSNSVLSASNEGDLILICKTTTDELIIIAVQASSTFENQLLWLFDIEENQLDFKFNYQPIEENDAELDFAVRFILEELGVEIEEDDAVFLDNILDPFIRTGIFPSTNVFSKMARDSLDFKVSALEEPDKTVLSWVLHEEKLFKRLERHIVAKRLNQGFVNDRETDVDGFIGFSLSVQNRRKSRMGHALENHLEEILKNHCLTYSKNKTTENKSKPDFIFPSIGKYKEITFPSNRLTMLGVKSSCKDRWRQVLSEAARIERKHLFTLEPSISENQTAEMQANNLQLVLPTALHDTYKSEQKSYLMDLNTFLALVKERQISITI